MKNFICLFLTYFLMSSYVAAKDLRFVQVTDVRHIQGDTTLRTVVNDINKEDNVSFVVFTGDNITRPNKEDLASFIAEAKRLHCPFYVVIGDKDVNKHKDLSKKQYVKFLHRKMGYKYKTTNYVFERGGVVFFVLDGARDVIPMTNGYYKDDVLEWFDANLDLYTKKNVVVLQHFPIIAPNDNENYMTYKPEKYLNILENHKNVKAVISGHYGVNSEQTVDGVVHISTAPAPQYRIIDLININTKEPTIWAEVKKAE